MTAGALTSYELGVLGYLGALPFVNIDVFMIALMPIAKQTGVLRQSQNKESESLLCKAQKLKKIIICFLFLANCSFRTGLINVV